MRTVYLLCLDLVITGLMWFNTSMEKRKVIVIGGGLGAGKTSTSRGLAEKLGYDHFGGGIMQRRFAEELGLDYVTEYLEMVKTDPTWDNKVDAYQKEFLEKNEEVVADGHAAYFFAPFAFKVFLDLDAVIAGKRIFEDMKSNPKRTVEKNWKTLDDVYQHTKLRQEKDIERFQQLFGPEFNHLDKSNFDLVIDTSKHTLEEVIDLVIEKYQQWIDSGQED
jgi:cytidylate kinase